MVKSNIALNLAIGIYTYFFLSFFLWVLIVGQHAIKKFRGVSPSIYWGWGA